MATVRTGVTRATRVLQCGHSWLNGQIVGPGVGDPSRTRLDPSWPAFLRIGHRGAGALAPENTLRGIEAALHYGVEMVEVDVRSSADGVLVLMHDDDLRRTTGREGRVSASTLAELRSLTVGTDERIPTLEEALALLRGRALVNLDQKRGIVPLALLRAIDRAGRREETLLTGRGRETFPLFRGHRLCASPAAVALPGKARTASRWRATRPPVPAGRPAVSSPECAPRPRTGPRSTGVWLARG
jgi:hypothetical protein